LVPVLFGFGFWVFLFGFDFRSSFGWLDVRFNGANALDEVSMTDPDFFDNIEWLAREVRRTKHVNHGYLPFGGIQVRRLFC
jgi:hypothetical protein